MATLKSFKKAYEALKDSTMLGLAETEHKDVDIAIVKATSHTESPPEEQHVREILEAISGDRPASDVTYCVHALANRLVKTSNWVVALKTLIVIHRILREGDVRFREELIQYSLEAHFLRMSNFKDDSSILALDCSAWVRLYALFLEERLECFRILKYDIEAEQLKRSSEGSSEGISRRRCLGSQDLLEQLTALQQLLFCLMSCQPEGAAFDHYLIKYALSMVVKESFKIYCLINDGIINLVDLFFEMSKQEALKALDIYRRAIQQALNLSEFYEICKCLDLARNFQFPVTKEPPRSLIPTMEEYIREAPEVGLALDNKLVDNTPQLNMPTPQLRASTKQDNTSMEQINTISGAKDALGSTVDTKIQVLKFKELDERLYHLGKEVILHLRILIALLVLTLICVIFF